MKYTLSVVFLLSARLLTAQQTEFGWLIGTWKEDNKMSFEAWKSDGKFLSGSAYKVDPSGSKTVTEEIKLIKRGDDFYYIPDVAGPQGAVEFKITSFTHDGFTAENPGHDFPKKIAYKNTEKNQLAATVSGGTKSTRFTFRKIE